MSTRSDLILHNKDFTWIPAERILSFLPRDTDAQWIQNYSNKSNIVTAHGLDDSKEQAQAVEHTLGFKPLSTVPFVGTLSCLTFLR